MGILKIEILNPIAKSILKNLADLNLISIKRNRTKSDISKLLSKLRKYPDSVPSADDIAAETEAIRKERYGRHLTENHSGY
jgi:hypothetical protein